ncbi:hypothetical protein C8R46DRAFT_626695 [Mycena filopes]|nr:hypothetical protein C8R46DRAFT_626695 [Mycena filopes]
MNASPSFHYGAHKQAENLQYASLQQIYPMRPRHEYRASDSDFPLRPVSLSPPPPPPARRSPGVAVARAHARVDVLNRTISSTSTHRPSGRVEHSHQVDSSSYSASRPRAQERLSSAPSLSVFNAPTATFYWHNLVASSQMRHDPVLYATYHNRPSLSADLVSDSDSEDSSEDERRTPSSSTYRRRDERTALVAGGFESFRDSVVHKREPSVDISQPSSQRAISAVNPRRRTSPASSTSSDHPIFDIGLPPRQDHRSGPTYSSSSRTSPSTTSTARSEGAPTSPGSSQQVATGLPAPNRNWENHAIPLGNKEGPAQFQCTWILLATGQPCPYFAKKQLVKRHVQTTHLKMKPYICDVCEKGFPQKSSLEIHRHGQSVFLTSSLGTELNLEKTRKN